ncbi:hypothetical protein Despr_1464 [Desulfobulbus propionicus DSM 2032]|jgi:hypothetical protein|uniref:Uncharacterized protein n=1 Tax=Desulfobulbus propionicus (strain ATCC 33891 / DSM 2032 / VKM B-1956 / 1pr3) TaxID=577650 RepID=A0A7U4DP28_DESPD|nr:hypothetical protein [Desulfobulbus propionicus]ADW17619.1 hypothetical protein Despr_1464 [Desulfobulbus propionicus DSM 2032]
MEITKIVVTDLIMAGGLFAEEGYDVEQSADNLADLKGQIIVGFLEEVYPGVEVYADIAIQRKAGQTRPLEVLAYSETKEIVPSVSAALREQLERRIAEASADLAWAVRQE